jgi:rod shape-determining protein MreB
MLRPLSSWFSRDLAIDLGTSTTRVYLEGQGIVATEPSVVAIRRPETGREEVLAVGLAADAMLGRVPADVEAVRPLRDGAIADFDATHAMMRHIVPRRSLRHRFVRPRMLLAVPAELSGVERRAARECALLAGAREVHLINGALAAAVGVGLPVTEPAGNMIIDIGAGTTEVAVISVSGVVSSRSLRVAGDRIDEALMRYVKRKYDLVIGEATAENLKIRIGTAYPTDDMSSLEIRGRDLVAGVPRAAELSAEETREAIAEPIARIVESVKLTLEETPPELCADIVERGVLMVGGGSLLAHLDELLREATGLSVMIAPDPKNAVALGLGRILEDAELAKTLLR